MTLAQAHRPSRAPTAGTALLLVGAVALGGMAAWLALATEIDTSAVVDASPPAATTAAVAPSDAPGPVADIAALTETTARPLFSPDRRPVARRVAAVTPQPVAVPTPPPAKPFQGVLVGLASSPQLGRRALVRQPGEADGTWLRIGDEVDGWQLREIGSDSVVVANGNRRHTMQLLTTDTGKALTP